MLEIRGRGAIVAGARRVGATVVKRLAREGVSCAITYRSSRQEAEALLQEILPLTPEACVLQADLSSEDDCHRAVEEARQKLGDLSFCINLASDYPRVTFDKLDARAWDAGLAAARGSYLLGITAARVMMQNPGPTRGHLVLFGDWAAQETPYLHYLPYLTGKAAIHFLVRGLGKELAPHGILVNAVSPGPTQRPPDMSDSAWQAALDATPLRRESSAEEIAEIIAALLKMETVTGENIRVDAGRHLGSVQPGSPSS